MTHSTKPNPVTFSCLLCGKEKTVKGSYAKRAKYCSMRCSGLSRPKELSNAWRGGRATEREQWQGSVECREWRKAVFVRDNFACVLCQASAANGTRLEADHIKPWAFYPELRADVSNGRTLCKPCHRATDTWGAQAKKYKIPRSES